MNTTQTETLDRNQTIKRIRAALKARTGKTWSVTGGRGTAWGWITIDAPPSRRTKHYRLKLGTQDTGQEAWEPFEDRDAASGYICEADAAILAKALDLERIHDQGESIPASSAHRREYVNRAEGKPYKVAEQYWD